jgi:hypothetical protein
LKGEKVPKKLEDPAVSETFRKPTFRLSFVTLKIKRVVSETFFLCCRVDDGLDVARSRDGPYSPPPYYEGLL